ncbi:MAG: PEP-CTERM sorting domain-containing protein [Acidobacteriota bacterium]
MKPLLSSLCLLLGASVASYAGLITSTTGTNLTGPSSSLQNFDNAATFPLASFTTLPTFTLANGVQVVISASGPSTPGSFNNGNTGRVGNTVGGVFGTSTTAGVGSLSGQYLQTWNGSSVTNSNSFVRTLTFTFSSGVSEFLIDYFDSNSGSSGTAAHALTVSLSNGTVASNGLAQTNSNVCGNCLGTGKQIGWVGDGNATINSFSIVMGSGKGDQDPSYGGDFLILDNLRVVASQKGGGTPPPQPPSQPGDIPEPSTYALLGAGLLSLAYARRRK